MISRRDFVKLSTGAAVTGLIGLESAGLTGKATAATSAVERIGVQLYTVRHLLEKDFAGTLESVARIGFHEVEFHDYFGHTPQQVRALLEELGLDAPAAHFPWQGLNENLDGIIDSARTVGHRYVILAWLPPEDRATVDQIEDLAELCNRWGETCKDAGLQFAYHNHDFEFEPIDDQVPFDILLNATDPDLVEFEIDLFWILKAGEDPLEYFESYPGRFTLCHVKDMTRDQQMADVGAGQIDFAEIFRHAGQAGLEYYFIEHDEPAEPLASIQASYNYLAALQI
jgi:sugar phosphate isomerase/epimerase